MAEVAEEKKAHRKTVDHFSVCEERLLAANVYNQRRRKRLHLGRQRPDSSFLAAATAPEPASASAIVDLPLRFVHVSTNKSRHAIHAVKWTPDARRVLVSSYSGEFTLWNGANFSFESIMQAHDSPIFSLEYSHNARWLLSGDQAGCIKFWQPNFNNVNIIQGAHGNAVQDLKFSPNDAKFVSCSDDQLLKVWDFATGRAERTLKGHHWDVKACDWHPSKGLVVSASKDNLVKFWDPRDATCLATIHDFKHTVAKAAFQPAGSQQLLAACSRDHSTRIFDIRMMKSIAVIRTKSEADLSALTWHPIHASMLSIGGYDGSINHFNLDKSLDLSSALTSAARPKQIADPWHGVPHAHEKAVYTMEYHPLGHVLCTAGADKSMRFWSRGRPNEPAVFSDSAYTGEERVVAEEVHGEDLAGPAPRGGVPGLSIPGFGA